MKHRPRVLAFLILLFAITYIDRVCISVAGPRMQAELGISPVMWGWVTTMFTLSYCLFEIPTGALGDRIGPRRVLTRVVAWWSVFTSLTGLVSSFWALLVVRFCFGAGEAGAFPNATIVIARWFPARQRASVSGVILMASQIGGALAPLLIVPIQMRYGWRASFFVFGAVGLVWAATWYWWFRDSPREMPGIADEELAEVRDNPSTPHGGFPWRVALGSPTVLALLGTAFCYIYVVLVLPDVAAHVPRAWPRLRRGQPAAVGDALRGWCRRPTCSAAPPATRWCGVSARRGDDGRSACWGWGARVVFTDRSRVHARSWHHRGAVVADLRLHRTCSSRASSACASTSAAAMREWCSG